MIRATCTHIGAVVVLAAEGLRCAKCDAPVAFAVTPPTADVYSTRGGPLPPGRSRRWLRDHAREIEGARRVGGRRGRGVEWLVPRVAYERWLDARSKPAADEQKTAPAGAEVVDLDAWINNAGYRTTRAAGRKEI